MMLTDSENLIVWGHGLAASGFLFLAIFLVYRQHRAKEARAVHYALITALFLTGGWAICAAAIPFGSLSSDITETARNAGWLTFMLLLFWSNRTAQQPTSILYVYGTLFALLLVQLAAAFAGLNNPNFLAPAPQNLLMPYWIMRMLFAAGALTLVHDIYSNSDNDARWGIRLPLAALAAMWCYDLNYYSISYLLGIQAIDFLAARGIAMLVLVPVMALGMRRNTHWNMRMSRRAAFHSASVLLVGAYVLLMIAAVTVIDLIGGSYADIGQVALVFTMSVMGVIFIPSGKFKATLKVYLAKHFYQYRYEYRDEWMRFTDTMGRADDVSGPVEQRVTKAIADICESPSALLFMRDNIGGYRLAARWNWAGSEGACPIFDAQSLASFTDKGFIVDLDDMRQGHGLSAQVGNIPHWLLEDEDAWVLLPLVHFGELVGLSVLARPRVPRRLDWEDLDMLRVAGAQAASYLAEAIGREKLLEVQRFDEFNRRFAFIMHDIKNLVSQLSLLARNAERHADNPEFRADMAETLQSSVGKMNEMLARLSQHHKKNSAPPHIQPLQPLLAQMVREKKHQHPLQLEADAAIHALVDAARVEAILGHLVQNAIDASDEGRPVQIHLASRGPWAAIRVIDTGCGISEEFLRERLFKPFSSSKEGGFGIGAYEAQMLAQQMGGRIEAESQLGQGSIFTLLLPTGKDFPILQISHKNKEEAV